MPMIKSQSVEKLENSRVKLSVTVSDEEAKKEYDGLLKKYAKDAHIKGFRPGKVPVSVIESKFGDSIRVETAQKLLQDSLEKIYAEIEEKPLKYAAPELDDELDFNPGQAFSYAVTYDIYPQFEVKEITGFTIEEPQVSIDKDAIERELERIQEKNAIITEKSEGTVEKDNIVTINYAELDERDVEIEDSQKEDYVLTVGSGYNLYKIDDDVTDMERGEEKIFEKSYSDDEKDKSLAGQTKKLKLKVTKIKELNLPELDDELAQDVDEKFETLDDLKKDIKKKLADDTTTHLRKVKTDALIDQLVEKNPVVLPESMINAELNANWENFVRQFGGDEKMVENLLIAQNSTRDSLYTDWRPAAEKRLKAQLILQKLIEDRKIEADEDAITNELKNNAAQNNMTEEEIRDYYEENNMMDYLKQDLKERRIIDQLLEENSIVKGKKVKYMDFIQGNA